MADDRPALLEELHKLLLRMYVAGCIMPTGDDDITDVVRTDIQRINVIYGILNRQAPSMVQG